MAFIADEVVEPLDWDFSKYGAGKGTTPEPTTIQIERFHRRATNIAEAMIRLQGAAMSAESDRVQDLTPEQAKAELERWGQMNLDQALETLDRELDEHLDQRQSGMGLVQKMAELIAETAQNQPNTEQIMALPHRIRSAYFGWFSGQLINPELVAAGTKRSLSLVHSD